MPEAVLSPEVEARLHAEVERSVAPYVGKVPPFMVAKLRELAERYWRENPQASRILRVVAHKTPTHSGTAATAIAEGAEGADRARQEARTAGGKEG